MKKTLLSLATALVVLVSLVACKDAITPYINPEIPFVETTVTPTVSKVSGNSATVVFTLGDESARFYAMCEPASSVSSDAAAIAALQTMVSTSATSSGLSEAQVLKSILKTGTNSVAFGDLQISTDYVAYVIQADYSGNYSVISSSKQAFTTTAYADNSPVLGIYSTTYSSGDATFTLETYGDDGLYNLADVVAMLAAYNATYGWGLEYVASYDGDSKVVTVDQINIGGSALSFGEPFVNFGTYYGAFFGGDTGYENWSFGVDASLQLSEVLTSVILGAIDQTTYEYMGYYQRLTAGTGITFVSAASVASKTIVETPYGLMEFVPVTPEDKYAGMIFKPTKELNVIEF